MKEINITWPMLQKKYEIMMLQKFIISYNPVNILEIGSHHGGTSLLWAKIIEPNNGKVYCIDQNFDYSDYIK